MHARCHRLRDRAHRRAGHAPALARRRPLSLPARALARPAGRAARPHRDRRRRRDRHRRVQRDERLRRRRRVHLGPEARPEPRAREMVAGCVNTGGEQQRSYYECLADRVMASNGTSDEDLQRLSSEMRAVDEKGAPVPAVVKQSVDYCAG